MSPSTPETDFTLTGYQGVYGLGSKIEFIARLVSTTLDTNATVSSQGTRATLAVNHGSQSLAIVELNITAVGTLCNDDLVGIQVAVATPSGATSTTLLSGLTMVRLGVLALSPNAIVAVCNAARLVMWRLLSLLPLSPGGDRCPCDGHPCDVGRTT